MAAAFAQFADIYRRVKVRTMDGKQNHVHCINECPLAWMRAQLGLNGSVTARPPVERHLIAGKTDDTRVEEKSNEAACDGFLVSGAGDAAANGCYTSRRSVCGREGFALTDAMTLYDWKGTWRLGDCGRRVDYVAIVSSPLPPESPGGCGKTWNASSGARPCPAIKRMGRPPGPKPPAPAPPAPPMRLVVDEQFNNGDTINTSLWQVLNQPHVGGWYSSNNVFLEDGALVLRTTAHNVTAGGIEYYVSSGAVNTAGRFYQRRGRWEARVKLPRVDESPSYTLHASVWLTAGLVGSPDIPGQRNFSGCHQEIDIAEQYVGGQPPQSTVLAHVDAFSGRSEARNGTGCKGGWLQTWGRTAFGKTADFTAWTTFRLDWTEKWVAMSINGTTYSRYRIYPDQLTDGMLLALTSAVIRRAPVTARDVFPQDYKIDYVRIYQWA